jgi:hypothetical protein
MKKIFSLILALALMLALTACSKPEGSEASTVGSVPESTTESRPLREGAYVFNDAIEFETYDCSLYEDPNAGIPIMHFGPEDAYASLMFLIPQGIGTEIDSTIIKQIFEASLERMYEGYDSTITVYDVTQVTIDNNTVWTVSADAELSGEETFRYIYWICIPNDGNIVYQWVFSTPESSYETNYPQVQAIVDSIRFI